MPCLYIKQIRDGMVNSEQNVQVCDATEDEQS